MKNILKNTTFRLFLAVVVGLLLGQVANETVIEIILPIKYVLGQIIFFLVPLIIFGFITPAITRLKKNASKLLGIALGIVYLSSVGVAIFAALVGYNLIPFLHIIPVTEGIKILPALIFKLDIPPILSVMSALALALMLGLSISWTKADKLEGFLDQFRDVVLSMVNHFLLPVLPFFIAANFAVFSYEGHIVSQLPIFLIVVLVAFVCNVLWLTLLYVSAGLYAKKNPWRVLKYYGPTILTAMGTQSSAASLGSAIKASKKSDVLRDDVRDFAIPLLGNIHFPGSVLDVTFLVIVVSQILYGHVPGLGSMAIFIALLGIFAIGAPGLPGGTVIASLGLMYSVLGFDESGTALLLTVFALHDSFGTANNITSDGALVLFLSAYEDKHESRRDIACNTPTS
ncbi:MAG: dicarboxylate/amino acid:cation symporter [Candidatus Symbiothrix sp.]|jgi:Na+/H+-dicarboxylate symporter|nr:dicarboxylate/amino acid:cation symporter [Candidatus Symbiothrix sp.]